MQSFFWQVLANPRVYKQLVDEVDAAVLAGSLPATGNVSWAEGQSLAYFQACLKEAMRVRPAVGVNITRLVPPEGAELDGHHFPAGTRLAVNGWVLHRDKPMFGEDADEYRPERWTEDEERARLMERYMFQVRGCPLPGRLFSVPGLSPTDTLGFANCSSAAAPTCASAGTSRCWRSTRSCHVSCGTSASS